eukprot:755040-Hanusia_phi.AAC.6
MDAGGARVSEVYEDKSDLKEARARIDNLIAAGWQFTSNSRFLITPVGKRTGREVGLVECAGRSGDKDETTA